MMFFPGQAFSAGVDLIVVNAKITTLDQNNPEAQAVAVKDGKILSVGNSVELLKLKDDSTQVIDADGKRIIPGLIDSHSHF